MKNVKDQEISHKNVQTLLLNCFIEAQGSLKNVQFWMEINTALVEAAGLQIPRFH